MAEDKKISGLDLNPSIDGTEEVPTERGGSNYKNTYTALKTWILSGVSGFVESVTGDGVDNTDPLNPVLTFPKIDEVGEGYTTNVALESANSSSFSNKITNGTTNTGTRLDETATVSTKEVEVTNQVNNDYAKSTINSTSINLQLGEAGAGSSQSNRFNIQPSLMLFGLFRSGVENTITFDTTKACVSTSLHGKGFGFLDATDGEANVGAWGTTPNQMSSDQRLIANLPSKTEVNDKVAKADVASETVKGGFYYEYDAVTSTLTLDNENPL